MPLHGTVADGAKPDKESGRGRTVEKVSAAGEHARLQARIGAVLDAWASSGRFGRVRTEWRFRVALPGRTARPLVADVAYLSFAAVGPDAGDDAVRDPLGAPTVAIEIVSGDGGPGELDDKVATYLRGGSAVVVVVDPQARTVQVHEPGGTRLLGDGDVLRHDALPGFSLDLVALFAAG